MHVACECHLLIMCTTLYLSMTSTSAAEASINSVYDLNGFKIGVLETMAEVSSGSSQFCAEQSSLIVRRHNFLQCVVLCLVDFLRSLQPIARGFKFDDDFAWRQVRANHANNLPEAKTRVCHRAVIQCAPLVCAGAVQGLGRLPEEAAGHTRNSRVYSPEIRRLCPLQTVATSSSHTL